MPRHFMPPEFEEDTGIPHFPTLLRRDTGLMEFVCIHGVGHPAAQSAAFLDSLYLKEGQRGCWSVHGCDGCCGRDDMPDVKYIPARLEVVCKDVPETTG